MKLFSKVLALAALTVAASHIQAAQLSNDARTAVPRDIQQLVVIDYRTMQNYPTAMQLRDRIMPPELRQFEDALRRSGLNENHDVEQLAFAIFRTGGDQMIVGVAQGQFSLNDILANFRKQKITPKSVRTNKLYPLTRTGLMACFIDPSTMIFGNEDAVTKALDARDGNAPNMLSNEPVMDGMRSVDSAPFWSILDSKGTQTMMRQVLGEAGSLADFDSVRNSMRASWYSMDFQHGVKFDLTVVTSDTVTAATASTLLSAAIKLRKMSCPEVEKQALTDTTVDSSSGKLLVRYSTSDDSFNGLLHSELFKSMIH